MKQISAPTTLAEDTMMVDGEPLATSTKRKASTSPVHEPRKRQLDSPSRIIQTLAPSQSVEQSQNLQEESIVFQPDQALLKSTLAPPRSPQEDENKENTASQIPEIEGPLSSWNFTETSKKEVSVDSQPGLKEQI